MERDSGIAVVGAGSWGTALALLLANKGKQVVLWGHRSGHIEAVKNKRVNSEYLPGVVLPESIVPTDSLAEIKSAQLILIVTPSKAMREIASQLAVLDLPDDAVVVSCTKGIERGTGLRMSEILKEQLPRNPIAVLSGPSHAEEVAIGTPTAVVLGCENSSIGQSLQQVFATPYFRTYTSEDITGIELGGALKNIFAISAGICDGLGLGDNTKAALVTRALAELVRVGTALGGKRETFHGLSGIGDLMVTCFSRHSRNRGFGERLGRGETMDQIASSMSMVAEGVPTTLSVYERVKELGINAPIITEVYKVLYGQKVPREALMELMGRDLRPEEDIG